MKLVGKAILVLITVAMAVTITLLGITADNTVQAQGSIFTVNSTGDAIDQSHPAQIAYSGDDIVVTMSLASVSDQLTFNQSHVEDNRLEYRWGVRIDTDGNVSTGDGSGYDVEISLIHFKPPGNSPFTGTILDGTQKNTWVLSGSSHLFAHNIEAEIDHDTKSIIMIAKQSWEEFADFDINDRFCCKTYYYSSSGSVQDITSDNPPGSNIVSDPEGDVSYSFVDITGGKVQLPDTIPPSVSLTYHEISHTADYSVTFTISEDVAEGEYIIVEFPNDTDITSITDTDTDSDVTVAATSGTGSTAFNATATGSSSADTTLTITLPDVNAEDKIGAGATVQVAVSGVVNPSAPGDYTLEVSTTNEDVVESAAYTITPPTIPPVPGIVQLYNPADILMAQYTGDDAIQSAIDDAWAGWTVKVGAGTYKDNIELEDGVRVLGAGADMTTIDGSGSGSVVTAIGVDSTAKLDGFTIINGLAKYGGGMYNHRASPTVTNCTFEYNSASEDGGGMYNWDNASPTVSNCTFSNNQATGTYSAGGGMYNWDNASPTVSNCIFSSNSAHRGGGMYIAYASPTVTNCTLSGNVAHSGGGGMDMTYSSSKIISCMFQENSAPDGGAMGNRFASPMVTNCMFSSNSAHRGGGIYNYFYSPTITNCKFSNNSAWDGGGGIFNHDSSPTVIKCTFSDNSAGWGGGMYNGESSPTVTDCTFYSNSAINGGGGMYNHDYSSAMVTNCILSNNSSTMGWGGGMHNHKSPPAVINSTFFSNSGGGMLNWDSSPTITNCIFWDNEYEISNSITLTTVTYCDIQGGYPGDHNISADPVFVDAAGDDYHLQAGSPCIDTGTNEGAPTEDIESNPRPLDGDGDGTATTDMGAYEYAPSAVAVEATVDFDPDTLNLKSKGKVVTVYIELPEGYDVEKTDVSTVMLNGIVPALAHPTDVGDYDSDGVSDLMVKFDRSDVQDVLEPGNEVEVTVSGQLTDGTSFEGADTIRVIEKEKK